MMQEEVRAADLPELARLPDVLAVCSSAGWTDRKHMLYLSLLQESFVNQLHGGELSLKGLVNLSPRASRPKQSSKVDRAKYMPNAEQVRPPCCEHQEDGEVHSKDDDASTTETLQESSSYQASATSSGQSSTSHFGKRKRSPSRAADSYKGTTYPRVSSEGSDQNFIDDDDEDTKGSGESRRRRSNKRLKSADDTMDDQLRERQNYSNWAASMQQKRAPMAVKGHPKWMPDYLMQGLDHLSAKVMDQKENSRP